MPNVMKVLKEEISRISRKEAKAAVSPVRKPSARYRKDIADLKRRMALQEKANKQLQGRLAKVEAAQPAAPTAEPAGRGWISGEGIKSLRKRLGLSQADFARLVGVSDQAVCIWENKSGMLRLRDSTKTSVFAVRGIGVREAKRRLEAMEPKPSKATKKAASRRSHRGKSRRRR